MNVMTRLVAGSALLPALALLPSRASAASIADGSLFTLHNGANAEPAGLILDNAFGPARWAWDFDHASSAMFLEYVGGDIHIYGQSYGGAYIPGTTTYQAGTEGVFEIDFLYDSDVGFYTAADGGEGIDDLWVTGPTGGNEGWIKAPDDTLIEIVDESNGTFTFIFGDDANDFRFPGYNTTTGFHGWGWLDVVQGREGVQDWLFSAKPIPEPMTVALMGAGIGGMALMRRRRHAA